MADDALVETATKAVERLLAPVTERLKHIEKELDPLRAMAAEISRIGQHLQDRDARIERQDVDIGQVRAEARAADAERQKEIRALQKEADQNKWVSRVAVALLLAGVLAWFQRSGQPPPIYVNVAPASAPAPHPATP